MGRDRFASDEILDERWLGAPRNQVRQRWRLVRFAAEPERVARVVDHVAIDSASGAARILYQEAMWADAIVVAVPAPESPARVAALLQAAGFATQPVHSTDAVVEVRLAAATLDAVPDALAALAVSHPHFIAEPDFLHFPTQTAPADYPAPVLWGLESIEAPAAWTVSTGSAEVVVAVIDTGMATTHPDLAANLWINTAEIAGNGIDDDGNGFIDDRNGWNFAGNNATVTDPDGHGTHVSGTIGAVGNNGAGITGVNWNVRLLPLRAGNSTFSDSALLNALRYVTTMRQRGVNIVAINASFGGGAYSTTFRTEIANAGAAGVLFVAAAGNDASNNDLSPSYPASYDLDSIISVASVQQAGGLSVFSDYGAVSVDLGAPGTEIYSTLLNGSYGYASGTSMAAPHVTGAVALVAAANPGLSAAQLRTRILETVEPVAALSGRVATGGKLNLRRAVAPSLVRPRVAITTPAARVVAIAQAGLGLDLVATLQPENGVTPAASLAWDLVSGPAAATFTTLAGAQTNAMFPAAGLYRVRVRATANGLTESDEIAIAVATSHAASDGLRAWWHFDESSGAALDASGDGRTGTLNGATRTTGPLGSAASFNGSSGNIAFTAPTLSQVSIAGWVYASGRGSSIFPRVVHMRQGLLFFGLETSAADDGNHNTLKFALDNGTAVPVWHSPPNSISTGAWYHVAATYDPTEADATPRFYINGVAQFTGAQSSGAVTPSVGATAGYIGDRGDGARAWQGAIDELRIYNRPLDAGEVTWLAHEVTLAALTNGSIVVSAATDSLQASLEFSAATTGFAAPQFAGVTWTSLTAGLSFSSPGTTSTTALASAPGDYLVRLDATTADGVHVVRTVTLSFIGETVATEGYYTGTTADGGGWVLIVRRDGTGTFFAWTDHGVYQTDFSVTAWGAFSFTDSTGASVSGRIEADGDVTGTIGGVTFAGARVTAGFTPDNATHDGDYAGWVLDSGVHASALVEKGRIAVVVEEAGTYRAGEGAIAIDGSFAIAPADGVSFVGQVANEVLRAVIVLPGAEARTMVLFREGFSPSRRLTNLSVRGRVGSGAAALIPGFVVEGSGTLPVLVRAVGPGLARFDLTDLLPDPRLILRAGSNVLAENAGWSLDARAEEVAAATTRIGAFALDSAQHDAALLAGVASGTFTAEINSLTGSGGLALAEIYDARENDEAATLVNLSARGQVGAGDDLLIGGFIVAGEAPALLLVRAAGPALAQFDVPDVLAAPVLSVYRDATELAHGAAWADGASATRVAAAATRVGAFAFENGSADAALLLFIEPGSYTAQVRGLNDTTGIALVEVYLVPTP